MLEPNLQRFLQKGNYEGAWTKSMDLAWDQSGELRKIRICRVYKVNPA